MRMLTRGLQIIAILLNLFVANHGYAIEPESTKESHHHSEHHHNSRQKRSIIGKILDVWTGLLKLSGFIITYFPEEIFFDIFGDKSKKERIEMERHLALVNDELQKLKKEPIQDPVFDALDAETEHFDAIRAQHEADVALMLSKMKDKKAAIRKLCGDTNCKEFYMQSFILDQYEKP